MCRSMYIVFALFLARLSNVHADYESDMDELKNLFGRKIQHLETKLEEEKAKTNEILRQQREEKAKTNEITRQLQELESKLDEMEKREQQNNRSKRQVVGTVAFSAYLNHYLSNLGPDHIIQFQGVVLNEGNAYNPHTGVFTVPLNGVYFFTYTAEDFRLHREWLKLVVDGQLYSSTVFGSIGDVHFVGSNVVLVRLRKGQSVWVAVDSRETTGGSLQGDDSQRFTTFSGFYLYE